MDFEHADTTLTFPLSTPSPISEIRTFIRRSDVFTVTSKEREIIDRMLNSKVKYNDNIEDLETVMNFTRFFKTTNKRAELANVWIEWSDDFEDDNGVADNGYRVYIMLSSRKNSGHYVKEFKVKSIVGDYAMTYPGYNDRQLIIRCMIDDSKKEKKDNAD